MSSPPARKYPTAWQRKTMWAALTAIFVVLLVVIVGAIVWLAGNLISFLQPILIPVAIAAILAYLLDPVVTHLSERRMSRGKAVALIFAIAFLGLAALTAWIVPTISMQSANFTRELPAYTTRARDKVVDFLYRYDQRFRGPSDDRSQSQSATRTFVNWLLASPTPSPTAHARHPNAGRQPPPRRAK